MRTLPFGETFGETFNAPGASFQTTLSLHAGSTRTPLHSHANDYVCFVLAGGFRERSSRGSFVWEAGDAICYHAEEWHEDSFGAHGARCINVHLQKGFQLHIESCGRRCNASARSVAEALAAEAALHFASDHLSSDALAAELLGALSCESTKETDDTWVSRLIEVLDDESRRNWTLSALASLVGRHPTHVARAFRRKTGLTIGAYRRRRRLTELCLRLKRTRADLVDIATDLGYADQSHMSREFRAFARISPGAYRRAAR
jgi:AraC family transcriptional regulator